MKVLSKVKKEKERLPCWVVVEHVESGTIKRDKEHWRAGEEEDGKQAVLSEYVTFGIFLDFSFLLLSSTCKGLKEKKQVGGSQAHEDVYWVMRLRLRSIFF